MYDHKKGKLLLDHKSQINISNKQIAFISFFLAIVIIALMGPFIHVEGNYLYTKIFGDTTIADEPKLVQALQVAQDHGVIMGIYGWKHENYSELTPDQAKIDVENSEAVFKRIGLKPVLFIPPYVITGFPVSEAVKQAIESTGLNTDLAPYMRGVVCEYTWEWRNMTSVNDPRYKQALAEIKIDRPNVIMLHAQDWNLYTKQLINSYLSSSDANDETVRIDDIGVNTPKETIDGLTKFTQYKSVKTIIFAIIPASIDAYDGGNPTIISNIKADDIFGVYFLFFLITTQLPIMFFVIWKSLSRLKVKKFGTIKDDSKYPDLITVIVPAYNEERSIGRCINSLLKQNYKGKMEVIVVNDGSTDRTAEIIPQYPVKFINLQKNGGKANALNRAIKDAKGDIIVFTDGDSYIEKSAVSKIVQCFMANPEVSLVAGNVLINHSKKGIIASLLTYCQMIEYRLDQDIKRYLQGLSKQVIICPGALTAARSKVCETITYSDETVVEDADFSFTAIKNQMKVIRVEDAIVYTNAPETLRAWYKQRKRWWFGFLQLCRIHKDWGMKNGWVVYNYVNHIFCLVSVIAVVTIPYILLQYDNVTIIFMHAILYSFISALLYIVFIGPFLVRDKKLLLMVIPYMVIYSTMATIVLSYIYVIYLSGRGMKMRFGSRLIHAT
jgi:cellulose synthase/poly-beta-1,6-N-acetylglucosamine synthase-like glycosyltransferase